MDDSVHDYEETCNQLEILNRQMDASFDFAEKRRLLRHYRSEMEMCIRDRYKCLQGKDYGARKGIIPLFLAKKLADTEGCLLYTSRCV